jgi:chemotaxis protein MotB
MNTIPPDDNEDAPPEEQAQTQTPLPIRSRRRYGMFRRRGDINPAPSSAWLTTFTDLAALMLTFFVLLYAMSDPEQKSFSEIVSALRRELHTFYGPQDRAGPQDQVNIDHIPLNRALNLEYLESVLVRHMEEELTNFDISMTPYDDYLIISLPQEILFQAGSAEIETEGTRLLYTLGNVLRRVRNRIEVVGHADPDPITNPNTSFPSNWELSLERAGVAAAILYKTGYRKPINIRGYQSVEYENLSSDLPEDVRKKASRRIDIHIMRDDGRISTEKSLQLQ